MKVSLDKLRDAIEHSDEVQHELSWLLEVMRVQRMPVATLPEMTTTHDGHDVRVKVEVYRVPVRSSDDG